MSHFEHSPRTKPESTASTSTDAPRRPRGHGAARLLSQGADSRHESRRIAVGIATLALVSVVLANFGILNGARERLMQQRWGQLRDHTEAKREEIRELLWQFEREATFVAEQRTMRQWATRAAAGALSKDEQVALESELGRATGTFQL